MLHFLDKIDQEVAVYVQNLTQVKAEDLDLDPRAGTRLFTDGTDGIVVRKDSDQNLQYYGGFEYVDKYNRTEIGQYVFYDIGDDRVSECLEYYRNLETV
jgi:hypothetical protein